MDADRVRRSGVLQRRARRHEAIARDREGLWREVGRGPIELLRRIAAGDDCSGEPWQRVAADAVKAHDRALAFEQEHPWCAFPDPCDHDEEQ